MEKKDTLKRLTDDRDYEEKLVNDIYGYIIKCLDGIVDITQDQKKSLFKTLMILQGDSERHMYEFDILMQYVLTTSNTQF